MGKTMTVEKLISVLVGFNKDAKVNVIVHYQEEDFTVCFGGPEGVSRSNCETVSFYVDRLCSSEAVHG